MLCPNCRNENPSTADVCVRCGSDLTASIEIELLADSGLEPTPQAVATPAPPALELDVDDLPDTQEDVLQVSFDDDAGPPVPDVPSVVAVPLPSPSRAMSPTTTTPRSGADRPSHGGRGRRGWIAAAIAAIVLVALVLASQAGGPGRVRHQPASPSNAGIQPYGHPDTEIAAAPPPTPEQVPPIPHGASADGRSPGNQTAGPRSPSNAGIQPYGHPGTEVAPAPPPTPGQVPPIPHGASADGRSPGNQTAGPWWPSNAGIQPYRHPGTEVAPAPTPTREQVPPIPHRAPADGRSPGNQTAGRWSPPTRDGPEAEAQWRQMEEQQRRQEEQFRQMESRQREQQKELEWQQREQQRALERQQKEQQRRAEEQQRKTEERLRELERQQEENAPRRYVCTSCGAELMRTKSQGSPSSYNGGSCSEGHSSHSWSQR